MPPDHIPESISYILLELCKVRRSLSEQMLAEIGLHVGQDMFFVTLLAEEGLMQTELAERLHIQRATLTNMINRLEQSGFVERRSDPDDQRVARIYPTEKGSAVRDALQDVWNTLEQQTVQGMTLEERLLFRRLLGHAYANLSIPTR